VRGRESERATTPSRDSEGKKEREATSVIKEREGDEKEMEVRSNQGEGDMNFNRALREFGPVWQEASASHPSSRGDAVIKRYGAWKPLKDYIDGRN